jgi:YVTN family beta-propeller protein
VNVCGPAIGLTLSPDEREIYLALVSSGAVAVLDRTSLRVRAMLPTGGRPRGMAFDQTGSVLVIANEAGWVDIVPASLAAAGSRPSVARGSTAAVETA